MAIIHGTSLRNCVLKKAKRETNRRWYCNNRTKTGDFITDHYTIRQAHIIRGESLGENQTKIAKKDIVFLYRKAEKLGDEKTRELIFDRYYDWVVEDDDRRAKRKPQKISLEELIDNAIKLSDRFDQKEDS